MAWGDIQGRARTNPRAPQAKAVCDGCGEWRLHAELKPLMEYSGNALFWTGFLVCPRCLDKPQDQFRTPILPPDPVPIVNPRPEFFSLDRGQQGFTVFTIQPPILAAGGTPDPAKAAVLAAVALLAGVPTPQALGDGSGTLAAANAAQPLTAANNGRTFILVYNPTEAPLVVSTGTAAFAGDPKAIILGPGNALYWATAQGYGAPYAGAMTVIGYFAGQAYYEFEAPGGVAFGQLDFSQTQQSGWIGQVAL